MNWTVEYIEDRHFVTVVTEGNFDLDGHARMVDDICSHNFWKPGLNIFFDHRKLDFGPTDIEFMKKVSRNHEKNDKRIGDGKAAILMKSLADFGRGRQFELLTSDKVSAKLAIFLDEKKALSWLLG